MSGHVARFALVLMCFGSSPAWAYGGLGKAEGHRIGEARPATLQPCRAIAALANRGAHTLRAADLLGRGAPIDLRNDGHPTKYVKLDLGTAHVPAIGDETGNWDVGNPDDYTEATKFIEELSVVRIKHRIWQLAWAADKLDDGVALTAATDGTDVCSFRLVPRPPFIRMLATVTKRETRIYRALLRGRGLSLSSAGLDAAAVQAASGLGRPGTASTYVVQPLSWRVDLLNDRKPVALALIKFDYNGGRGCSRNLLGLVREGRVTGLDLLPLFGGEGDIVPISQALLKFAGPLRCLTLAETPVMGLDKRAYVLLDNTAERPTEVFNRVRLLTGARCGKMVPLARLSWRTENEVVSPRMRGQ